MGQVLIAAERAMDELDLLIVQPTAFCNIDCDYCYLPNRANKRIMDIGTLASVLEKVFRGARLGDDLTIVWHAGEPLSVPISFYENAHKIIADTRPRNCKVTFSFQSNGLLLTDRWCEFLQRTDSRIGLSIDGPKNIHDQQRRYRSGKGTFDPAMHAVALLKKRSMKFHVIAVVTNASLDYPTEIYEFMKGLGCDSWAFNIESLHGPNRRRSFADRANDEKVRLFLRLLFTTWLEDPERPLIREFGGAVSAIRKGQTRIRQDSRPFAILNVDLDGNVSTFSPELLGRDTHHGQFIFANLVKDELASMRDDARYKAVHAEIQSGIDKCRSSCSWFALCGGGTPASKYFEHGRFDATKTRDCETQRMIMIDEILSVLESKAQRRVQGNMRISTELP